MRLLIRGGTLLCADKRISGPQDVLIEGETITGIARRIRAPDAAVIDAEGLLVTPGLVDVHVHFREPGQEHKEDVRTGSLAAAAGGFTTVLAEPNTIPPMDTPARLRALLRLARQRSAVNFFSKAAISVGQKGTRLTDFAGLKKAGAVAVSDDGNPVPGRALMLNALRKARKLGMPVVPHCEESPSYRDRACRRPSGRLPYAGSGTPYTSEAGFIKRDLDLAERAGASIHISHVSLAESVEAIRAAKRRGVRVTAEATPHHLLLSEKDAREIGPDAKVNPPLRSPEDVAALRESLADGTIDVIASDHAPHAPREKDRPWAQAPFGVIGLETTLGVVLTHLAGPGILTLRQAVEKMTIQPARIFGLDGIGIGLLKTGVRADLTIIDPDRKWTVNADSFRSKARNCPFDGWQLRGRAVMTIVRGAAVFSEADMSRRSERTSR